MIHAIVSGSIAIHPMKIRWVKRMSTPSKLKAGVKWFGCSLGLLEFLREGVPNRFSTESSKKLVCDIFMEVYTYLKTS